MGLGLTSLAVIVSAWCWLGAPVALTFARIDPAQKLDCVSYAPFRGRQSPWNNDTIIAPAQIADDLADLAGSANCVRTYSVENGLEQVPELASKAGLKVILGVWLGRDRLKNADLVDRAVLLAASYPETVTSVVLGSEVLLRGDMTVSDLRQTIRAAKGRLKVPVTYADVWEFWERNSEVGEDVDFVTIHVLPYWEDAPVRAEDAAAHVDRIRKRMALLFPGKEIFVGETGWPGMGRMRDRALPSRVNQARFISEILQRARAEGFRVNLFEAYDERWKRMLEGTVGGSWGFFDRRSGDLKYAPGPAVSDHPLWKAELAAGIAFAIAVFAVAFATLRRRQSDGGLARWFAVAIIATLSAVLLGIAAEKTLYESYGFGGWWTQLTLLATAIVAPLLGAAAVMSKRPLPAFSELVARRDVRLPSWSTALGFVFIIVTLLAVGTALSLVFDPRWRDFPFAGLTMAVVPIWLVTFFARPEQRERPVAEQMFSGLLALAACYIAFNEGFQNWQSLWTSAVYLVLAATLTPSFAAATLRAVLGVPMRFSNVPDAGSLVSDPLSGANSGADLWAHRVERRKSTAAADRDAEALPG